MFIEERTYTLEVGKAAEWMKLYEAEGMAVQVPIQGHMVGYFGTEFGGLNQIIHIWKYQSLEDRMARRAKLFQDKQWLSFLAKGRPFLKHMENKLLIPAPFSPVGGPTPARSSMPPPKLVEERIYTLEAGKQGDYIAAYSAHGLEIQLRHLGQMVGWFTTEFGPLNQIVHLWGYQSLEDRAARRARLFEDTKWLEYVAKVRPFLLRQENKLLTPAPYSPIGGTRPVKNAVG